MKTKKFTFNISEYEEISLKDLQDFFNNVYNFKMTKTDIICRSLNMLRDIFVFNELPKYLSQEEIKILKNIMSNKTDL